MATRKIEVEIVGDATRLERAFGRAGESSRSFGRKLGAGLLGAARIGARGLAITSAASGVAGVKMLGLAGDAEEVRSKFEIVFGRQTPKMIRNLDAFSRATGTSRFELQQQTADLGALLSPMIGNTRQAGAMSISVTKLATDLASFNNVPTADALIAIRAGLVGEAEPMRRFGVLINAATVESKAYTMGLAAQGAELTEGQKVQARYALIMEQTELAQGDAERTSGSYTNQLKRFKASVIDGATALGARLIPAGTAVLAWGNENWPKIAAAVRESLGGVIEWVRENWPAISGHAQDAFGAVQAVIEHLRVEVVPTAVEAFQAIGQVVQDVTSTILVIWDHWGVEITRMAEIALAVLNTTVGTGIRAVRDVITVVLALLRGDWEAAWNALKSLVGGVLTGLKELLRVALTDLVPFVVGLALKVGKEISTAIWDGVKAVTWGIGTLVQERIIQPIVGQMENVLVKAAELSSQVPLGIKAAAWGFAEVLHERIIQPLAEISAAVLTKGSQLTAALAKGVRDEIAKVREAVVNAFRAFINAMLAPVRRIPIVGDAIPELAQGTILRGPTLAIAGEDGPEAIIPLGRKYRRQGRELLTRAAEIMGMPGDPAGPVGARAITSRGIPLLAYGGIVYQSGPLALTREQYVDVAIQSLKRAQSGGLFGRIREFAAQGAEHIINQMPTPDTRWPFVNDVGRNLRANVAEAVRSIIRRKEEWEPTDIIEAIQWSEAQMGKPYVWGGGHAGWDWDARGYDCSGFASHAAKRAGSPLAGPGTTMSLMPISRSGSNAVTWGFRGMSSGDPRVQHMGIRLLGDWYQFGSPGRKGGSDSQWDHLTIPPGLPGYAGGTPYVPRTGPAMLHRGEAVIPAGRDTGPLVHIEHLHVREEADVERLAAELDRRIGMRMAMAG